MTGLAFQAGSLGDHMTLPQIITCMLKPELYPHQVEEVKLIQTHISFVLLAGAYVYKVKKPVDLGFLDFSTLEKRQAMCQEELRLNRRLAQDVYLAVVPVYEGGPCGATLTPVPGGRPLEYAVKMCRLSEENMLPALLQANDVHEQMITDLGIKLAAFHASIPAAPPEVTADAFDLVRRNFEENFAQTRELIGSEVDQDRFRIIEDYTRWFLEARTSLFRQRVEEDRIRECHGDLRMEHICFEQDQIIIFDCIEFNTRFRCIDTAEDLAFLLMDMEFNGYWTEGRTLLDSYQRQARDSSMSGLLTFFKAYYAMTRGKVQAIKSREEEFSREEREQALNSAQAYFGLAYRYAARVEQPVLIIMCGLTGSGKSSLARALADSIGAEVLKSDEVRKDLAGVSRTEHHQVGFGQGLYSEEWTQKTYAALMQQGAELLKSGKPVILDASFLKRGQRSMARKSAIEHQVPFVCLQCECPREVARQRLAQRGNEDVSDGRWEIYTSQESAFEPFTQREESELIRVSTDAPLSSCTQWAVQGLLDTIRVSVASEGQR